MFFEKRHSGTPTLRFKWIRRVQTMSKHVETVAFTFAFGSEVLVRPVVSSALEQSDRHRWHMLEEVHWQ